MILYTGVGRLHLVQSARWLAERGLHVTLVQGWVPRKTDGWFMRLLCRIVGRNSLAAGFEKRKLEMPNVTVRQCVFADFLAAGVFLLVRRIGLPEAWWSLCGWRLFGWSAQRYLQDADVFHVRSVGGAGGTIRLAKKRGMKVLADHSIAHPAFMGEHLATEKERQAMGMDSPLWQQAVRDCEEADLVLVNSDFVKATFIEAGFPEEKLRVVYCGCRDDFFGLRCRKAGSGPLKLLFTGRFGGRKGAADVLASVQKLQERGLSFHLDVVGDYSDARANLFMKYPMASLPITFHGHLPQDELKTFLAEADVYVFPSLSEGCANSGMEAMAAGLCVVATRESGLPIQDGESGFIVPARSPETLEERILWLGAHPGEIDRTGANAALYIRKNCTWERYARHVEGVYRELLAQNSR